MQKHSSRPTGGPGALFGIAFVLLIACATVWTGLDALFCAFGWCAK